ncbi:MAG: cyclic nucleotide-binding domain-containing protein [Gammaproteobacteria bacterium]|nr:cyclic nucleotide-binding domain-containing protein [Gammaproteobacteria bacterium]
MATETPDKPYYMRRLAEYLACAPGTIKSALQRQSATAGTDGHTRRLGEILQELGSVTADELESAIKRQRVDRLRRCYVFSSLSQPELTALSTRFHEVSVPEGYQFIIQDEEDPTLYILATGKAEVYRTDIDGNWMHIAYLEPGEPIGEMGYFQSGHRTASVRAIERCELLCANYDDLTHYFENVPRVAHAFMKLVQERQRETERIREAFDEEAGAKD